MQSFNFRRFKDDKLTGTQWEIPILSDSLSCIQTAASWMDIDKRVGAKRFMRKNLALNCRRRPTVDFLESRCLLSVVFGEIEFHPAPALIIGTDVQQIPMAANGPGSLAASSVSTGPKEWPVAGFHHDFFLPGDLSTADLGFHGYPGPPVLTALISPIWEVESAPPPPANSESTTAVPGLQNHGDIPPGPSPPPGPAAFLMFTGGDPERIAHAVRDLSTKPPLDESTPNSTDNGSQADEITVPPVANQAAVQTQGGYSIGQIAPSFIVAPGNLTALFKPASEHDAQTIPMARSGETPGKPPVEMVLVSLPNYGSANVVPADDSIAGSANNPGHDIAADLVDSKMSGIQSKLLLPQAAGLVANAVPFDQSVIEKAVDQFFDQLESLGIGRLVEPGSTRLIPLSLALLGTVTVVEIAPGGLSPEPARSRPRNV